MMPDAATLIRLFADIVSFVALADARTSAAIWLLLTNA